MAMKRVERGEILGLADYEQIRETFRSRVIGEKRARRVHVCPEVSAVFENHDTVLFQIQEMLRAERITKDSGILHEIDTYNELIPLQNELSATMFVEIAEPDVRERMLVELAGLEGHIALDVGGTLVRGRNETRGVIPYRTTAVHYVKFVLGEELAARCRAPNPPRVFWVLYHPKLSVRAELPPAAMASIASDLEP